MSPALRDAGWLTGVTRHPVGPEAKLSVDGKEAPARQLAANGLLVAFHEGKLTFSPSPSCLLILGLWGRLQE